MGNESVAGKTVRLALPLLAILASFLFLRSNYLVSSIPYLLLLPILLFFRVDGKVLVWYACLSLIAFAILLVIHSHILEFAARTAYFLIALSALVLTGQVLIEIQGRNSRSGGMKGDSGIRNRNNSTRR